MSISILNGLAAATFDDPAKVLEEIQIRPFKYVVDEEKQTIQGFHIENPQLFWTIESAVHSSKVGSQLKQILWIPIE